VLQKMTDWQNCTRSPWRI